MQREGASAAAILTAIERAGRQGPRSVECAGDLAPMGEGPGRHRRVKVGNPRPCRCLSCRASSRRSQPRGPGPMVEVVGGVQGSCKSGRTGSRLHLEGDPHHILLELAPGWTCAAAGPSPPAGEYPTIAAGFPLVASSPAGDGSQGTRMGSRWIRSPPWWSGIEDQESPSTPVCRRTFSTAHGLFCPNSAPAPQKHKTPTFRVSVSV